MVNRQSFKREAKVPADYRPVPQYVNSASFNYEDITLKKSKPVSHLVPPRD
jgi:hypothetical protein